MDGETRKITPAPLTWGPAVPSSLVYDHYAWYKSIYRIKAELRDPVVPYTGTRNLYRRQNFRVSPKPTGSGLVPTGPDPVNPGATNRKTGTEDRRGL